MADKTKTGASATQPGAAAMSAITEMQKQGFGSLALLGTSMLENMGQLGGEVVQFVSERIKEDIKAQHEILHCKDMNELREIQTRFVQKAIDQYNAESGKLVQMSNEMLSAAMKKQED